jgi:hypothetical protein
MDEIIADFVTWGPHGLYATAILMLLSVPFSWLYAYTAYIGYKRSGITRPSEERRRAAIGGALITAPSIFLWRHVVGADWRQWYQATLDWLWHTTLYPVNVVSAFLTAQMEQAPNIFVRLFWAIVGVFAVPGVMGIGLGIFLWVGIFAGFGIIGVIGAGTIAVFGSVTAAIVSLPGFLLGVPILLYFLFVRLPIQVVYRRAIREGRWPTTRELVKALRKGTLGKTDWQSEIMEYKARKFDAGLRAEADDLRRKMRGS